jgi:hypothetical protein
MAASTHKGFFNTDAYELALPQWAPALMPKVPNDPATMATDTATHLMLMASTTNNMVSGPNLDNVYEVLGEQEFANERWSNEVDLTDGSNLMPDWDSFI